MTVADTPADDIRLPPCDLWSDELPLESDWHRDQIELLLACLRFWWSDRNDYYASGNLTIYYSEDKITTRDFRGPDFFVVLGTENRPRRSWMTWVEGGKYPNVIIELLSNSTANVDRNEKKLLYQDTFRTPEYLWFHPETLEFKGFRLMAGHYQPIEPNSRAWLWSQQLDLYLGIHENKLRFFTSDEILVPTPQERADQEAQRADQEAQQRRQAEYQVAALQAKLRELGVDPDTLV